MMKIKVNSYSGYKADERPVIIFIEGKAFEVKEVKQHFINEEIDGQRHEVFKVIISDDGSLHTILHDLTKDEWSLE
ncbi:MAG: hypothetical protein AB1567_12850 [bacterium]